MLHTPKIENLNLRVTMKKAGRAGKGSLDQDTLDRIRYYALENASKYGGKANMGSVMGKIMASDMNLRKMAGAVSYEVKRILGEVNSLTESQQEEGKSILGPKFAGDNTDKRPAAGRFELPPLKKSEKGVVMRFAPGPSGPLHIGHTRAAVINDEYVKRYRGKLIIRLEDTNPEKIDPEAYDSILEDLKWLGVEYTDVVIQSDRFSIYMEKAAELIEMGHAYVCSCDVEEWRGLKERSRECPHRSLGPDIQLVEWRKMVDGSYGPNEASVVVKTDLFHKNPAVRDFVAMRINSTPHPRTGSEFHIYPLYNFSVVVDDHLLGCTHILRGKDHLNNTIRQKYVYRYFGWLLPEFHHYGWVSMKDTLLKTSLIREGIKSGEFSGWDDVRLGTLRTMERRGIKPEAIRDYWKEVGIKPVDLQFSWANLYAFNKKIIDPEAERYYFVRDPFTLKVKNIDKLKAEVPLHPAKDELGKKNTVFEPDSEGLFRILIDWEDARNIIDEFKKIIDKKDGSGVAIRLKDLCNLTVESFSEDDNIFYAKYQGNSLKWMKEKGARPIHWVPENIEQKLRCIVHRTDGERDMGWVESHIRKQRTEVIQFERYGFVKTFLEDAVVNAYFTQT